MALSSTGNDTAKPVLADNANAEDEKSDEDEKLLDEMEELKDALEHKKKREKKKLARRRAKDKAHEATGMQIDATQDSYYDRELFSLASIKGKKELHAVDSTELDEDDDAFNVSGSEDENYNAATREDPPSEIIINQ